MENSFEAIEDMLAMERAISESTLHGGRLDVHQLNEAAREWDRLYVAAGMMESSGDHRFFQGGKA